jgi:hypothetical protein
MIGLNHGIERIVKIFEKNILSRLNGYPVNDAQVMAKCAADHFREKWNTFENGNFFDLPLLQEGEEFFVTRCV